MIIRIASEEDLETIHQLAHEIWWPTYQNFLPSEQISFMLNQMYSVDALKQQNQNSIKFLLAEREDKPIAFAGFSLEDEQEKIFKLHKIYVLPLEQGKGTGKKLIEYIINLCKSDEGKILELNVNRNNPALGFYKKLGFEIYKEVDIPYYEFILNDYVLRIKL